MKIEMVVVLRMRNFAEVVMSSPTVRFGSHQSSWFETNVVRLILLADLIEILPDSDIERFRSW